MVSLTLSLDSSLVAILRPTLKFQMETSIFGARIRKSITFYVQTSIYSMVQNDPQASNIGRNVKVDLQMTVKVGSRVKVRRPPDTLIETPKLLSEIFLRNCIFPKLLTLERPLRLDQRSNSDSHRVP